MTTIELNLELRKQINIAMAKKNPSADEVLKNE